MAWPGTLSTKTTGQLVDADDWNDVIDAINHLGNTHDHSGDDGDGGTVPGTFLYSSTTEVSVSNTTTQTTVFSYTIPANTLGTNQLVKLWMDYTFIAAGAPTLTFRIKLGSTTMITKTTAAAGFNQMRGPLFVSLWGDGATNAQEAQMWALQFNTDSSFWEKLDSSGTAAEDSTGGLTFSVTVQWSAANAGNVFKMKNAVLLGAYQP